MNVLISIAGCLNEALHVLRGYVVYNRLQLVVLLCVSGLFSILLLFLLLYLTGVLTYSFLLVFLSFLLVILLYLFFSIYSSLSFFCLCVDLLLDTQDSEPNRILLVTIHHMLYPMTVDVLHQVFSPHGFVEKIVTFQKSAGQLLHVFYLFTQILKLLDAPELLVLFYFTSGSLGSDNLFVFTATS